ncbi:MAG: Plastocyanin [Candidatus Nomurabacteria bacterium GW2011_GWF2_35_12]|uniref:Plastocyanin n=1 Tax=Candidatus Nomurabacteria bacterium GW2011_GWA1_36_15 TaxID=1618728 RepID=A0A0G0DT22_9BACT|nr:MAG: Plastocyanin [Candidatus Nomurabacteria bacterium GW2011_GWF2_35_12]KKP76317.1 MAG: Plastocyanin [Parcubacteria group bacterium GW2011_GWC1_35_21]KKP77818.1 MAG: Plastocyanin [Candidatus Nomurabacteria bacterium GW2011_GWC2_35_35]KKP97654.1 MAG: Plastocyanin [Candidatus Nomurabacteria bacterium GW2011_GWA1_36_15]HCY17613.1 hypothetical protein [Candidatus Nomurabacteria bacterium]
MKKTYTIVIVLILVVLGVLFFTGKGSKLEAPAVINDVSKESEETGLVSEEETTIAEVREFTISGQNFSFTPSSIMVKKGDKVKITLKNIDGFHDFKIDEYGVATKQLKSPAEEVLEFTADKVGSFEYYCSVGTHRAMGMFGTLKVE